MRALEAELKTGHAKVQPKEILTAFLEEEEFDVSESVKKAAAVAIQRYV
jgi:hypothetical protein